VRSRSSRPTNRPGPRPGVFRTVPDLQNGVRQPAITASAVLCSWHYILLDVGPHPVAGEARNLPRACCRASWRRRRARRLFRIARVPRARIDGPEPVESSSSGAGSRARDRRDAALQGFRTAVVTRGSRGWHVVAFVTAHPAGSVLEQGEFRLCSRRPRGSPCCSASPRIWCTPCRSCSGVPRRAGSRLEAPRGHVGVRSARSLPQREGAPLAETPRPPSVLSPACGTRIEGAALYYDRQTDDASARDCHHAQRAQAGALVANYAEATALLKPDGRVGGAHRTGRPDGYASTVRALLIVTRPGRG